MPAASSRSRSAAKSAVVLLSGGLDSTTVLAVARRDGFALNALTFSYGQRHSAEIEAAKRIAKSYRVDRHQIVALDLTVFGGSALTADIPVPKDRDLAAEKPGEEEIPLTYVPARNTIFLSYALAFAEVIGSTDILVGVNALDYSGYPDCRPEFIAAFQAMANLATRAGVEDTADGGAAGLTIEAPLQYLTKAQIVELGGLLQVDYSLTTSCYDPAPDGTACGRCDACQLRLRGFAEAGSTDPIAYATVA